MLEYEMSKQSERRGRFLIQEIEDDCDYTPIKNHFSSEKFEKNFEKNLEKNEKTNLFITLPCGSNNTHNTHSKRPKHSSIIIDSKIIHTTRMDSNYYSETFTTLIYEENTKDWVNFEDIWKGFSQGHVDVVEDDMEKIFHYIDKKIDDSDFFCVNNLNTIPEPVKKEIANEITNEIKIKNTKLKNKNKNRSVILTNFCGPSIVSPAISPINSSCDEKKIIGRGKKFLHCQFSEKGNQPILNSSNLHNNIYVEKFNFKINEEFKIFKNENIFKRCHSVSEILKKKNAQRNVNSENGLSEVKKESKKIKNILKEVIPKIAKIHKIHKRDIYKIQEKFQIIKNTEFSFIHKLNSKTDIEIINFPNSKSTQYSISTNSNNFEIKNTIEESYLARSKIPEDGPRCIVCKSKVE